MINTLCKNDFLKRIAFLSKLTKKQTFVYLMALIFLDSLSINKCF